MQPLLSLRLKLLRFVGKQTWIPKGQDRLLRLIWNPVTPRDCPFEVDFFGLRYPGNLAQFLDWHVFAYGSYASAELRFLSELTRELRRNRDSITFYDLGANVGQHSLFMSQHADQVISFEPFPELQEVFRQRMAINALTNVRLIPCALGDEDSVLRYFPGGGSNSGSGTFLPEASGAYNSPVEVQVRHAGNLFAELELPRIDLLKIDVEGFESKVFSGLRERIQRDRPPILMEVGQRVREGFGSEDRFRKAFYPDAVFGELTGRHGCSFTLKPFRYEHCEEAVVLPPELGDWSRQFY